MPPNGLVKGKSLRFEMVDAKAPKQRGISMSIPTGLIAGIHEQPCAWWRRVAIVILQIGPSSD